MPWQRSRGAKTYVAQRQLARAMQLVETMHVPCAFGVWNLEYGIWNLESGVCTLESGVWVWTLYLVCILDCGEWSLESEVWSLESGIWDLESVVWNLKSGIWHWSLESGVWSL